MCIYIYIYVMVYYHGSDCVLKKHRGVAMSLGNATNTYSYCMHDVIVCIIVLITIQQMKL